MKTPVSMFSELGTGLMQLFYPHLCAGCGDAISSRDFVLCFRCIQKLPLTNFHLHPGNPVEKMFWGRIRIESATSLCYFSKDTIVQRILHQLKYRGNRKAGLALGRLLGESLVRSKRFTNLDSIIPLPLHPKKEKIRGYNQAQMIADGIASVTGLKVVNDAVARKTFTETQTHRNRVERWRNMEDRFICIDKKQINSKNILLVDDLVTTGATLEACAAEILKEENTTISIATLAYAAK